MSIEKLPTEILTIILKHVCTQNLLQEYPRKKRYFERKLTTLSSPMITYLPALAVSAVCARWRVLSLALPGLWAQLKLEILDTATASTGIMTTLQLFLDRSAKAPLSLYILVGFTEKPNHKAVSLPTLNLLIKHTSRWKTVWYSHHRKLSKRPLFLPILEEFAIDGTWGTQFFESTPEIRTLAINDANHVDDWYKLCRPTLTYLIVLSLHTNEIDMLGDLPDLTVLKLGFSSVDLVGNFLPRFFPQVKSFTLQLESDGSNKDYLSFSKLLDRFILPSLNEFIICFGHWPVRAFSEFLSRSSCTLTHLTINDISISDVDFVAALQLLPSLTKLAFDDYGLEGLQMENSDPYYSFGVKNPITSFFLSRLTIRDSDSDHSPILVPLLQSLSIKLRATSFDDASFVEMVLSRWLPNRSYTGAVEVASLRSLVLRFHERVVDEDIYRPLFELDKVGMRWGREVKEEENLRPLGNLERMGMRVVITGDEYDDVDFKSGSIDEFFSY